MYFFLTIIFFIFFVFIDGMVDEFGVYEKKNGDEGFG